MLRMAVPYRNSVYSADAAAVRTEQNRDRQGAEPLRARRTARMATEGPNCLQHFGRSLIRMSPWTEDFSTCTLEELRRRQAENQEWSKELRRKTNSLVNSRLAHSISLVDYRDGRKLIEQESAECQRRAKVLDSEVARLTCGVVSGRR